MTTLETQYLEAERQLKQKQQHLKSQHPEAQPLDKLLWQVERIRAPCAMNGLHDAITSDGAMDKIMNCTLTIHIIRSGLDFQIVV